MDPVKTAFAATGLLYAAFEILSDATSLLETDIVEFGILRSLPLHTAFMEARPVIDRVRKYVLPQGDTGAEEAAVIRSSYADSFNMIGVAAAIVASVAITALGLDNIEATHWTTVAAFVVSLVAGSLSVYFACLIQLRLSALHRSEDIRAWLTTPRVIRVVEPKERGSKDKPRQEYVLRDRIASFDAALMLVAPAQLLNWSLISLLVGIGIYYGIVFSSKLGDLKGHNANLAVLLVYIVFTAGALALFFGPALWKRIETKYLLKKLKDINEKTQAGWYGLNARHASDQQRKSVRFRRRDKCNPFHTRHLQTLVMPLIDVENAAVQRDGNAVMQEGEANVVTAQHHGFAQAQDGPRTHRRDQEANLLRAIEVSTLEQKRTALLLERAFEELQRTLDRLSGGEAMS